MISMTLMALASPEAAAVIREATYIDPRWTYYAGAAIYFVIAVLAVAVGRGELREPDGRARLIFGLGAVAAVVAACILGVGNWMYDPTEGDRQAGELVGRIERAVAGGRLEVVQGPGRRGDGAGVRVVFYEVARRAEIGGSAVTDRREIISLPADTALRFVEAYNASTAEGARLAFSGRDTKTQGPSTY